MRAVAPCQSGVSGPLATLVRMAGIPAALDKFDRQILAWVQQDCRVAAETLAAQIGLSATAVQRRLRRLREAGVIEREVAVLDPLALGLGVSVWVEVQLAVASQQQLVDGFAARMSQVPEVQQCFYVAGPFDFLLLLRCEDTGHFERLSRELFFDQPNIRKFRSTFVLQECKRGAALPLWRPLLADG